MYKLRKEGRTLQAIAEMFDITRERVRQICAKEEDRETEQNKGRNQK